MNQVELRLMDVIQVSDGKRLGSVSDFEIDLRAGRITALYVPTRGHWFGVFGRERELLIPWEKIVAIGVDVILVDGVESTPSPRRWPGAPGGVGPRPNE